MTYITFLIFLTIFFYLLVKKRWSVSWYLVLVYTISLLFSVKLINSPDYTFEITLEGTLVFIVFLMPYFFVYAIKPPIIKKQESSSFERKFSKVGYTISILLLVGTILLLTKIQQVFAYGLVDAREDMYLGDDYIFSYTPVEHIGHSILRWLGALSYGQLLMFFYAFVFFEGKKLLKILLLLSSCSAIYFGLLLGGRTTLIYWVLYLGFCLVLFWPLMDLGKKKTLAITLSVPFGVLSVYFISITIARASLGDDTADNFFIRYAGQTYLYFCDFYENIQWHPYSLQRVFPLSSSIILGRFDLNTYRDLIALHTNKTMNVFYTFLGDIFVDLGMFGLVIFTVVYVRLTKSVLKKRLDLSSLLKLGVLIQVPLHGLFYYSMWQMENTVCIIITLIIAKYLKR